MARPVKPLKSKAAKGKEAPLQKRDPVKTRENILSWATKAFAKTGFLGTSLSEILEKAKVNKRMIYHYFNNKEGLYRAVHIQQWQALEAWFAVRLSQSSQGGAFPLNNEALLDEALTIFHEFIAHNQTFVRLLMWDGLEGGVVSRSIWNDIRGPIYYRMEALIQMAQGAGLMSPELKPSHLIVTFMGAISFYFAYANSLEDIFHKPPLSPEMLAERKDQVMKVFHLALRSSAAATSS